VLRASAVSSKNGEPMSAESMTDVDVAVVGAGPGGYVAAFHAADLGMKVALVSEDARPGGVCLLRGCIPSKALLHVAKIIHEAWDAGQAGVTFSEPKIDLAKLRSWKNGVVDKLTGGLMDLAGRRSVQFIHARARFTSSQALALDYADKGKGGPAQLRTGNIILATGSLPSAPAALHLDDPRVMDSTAALALPDVPDRLGIIGGGYIGLESGTYYAALGSHVTVIEMTDGLLPGVDRDLVRVLHNHLARHFEAVYLNAKVERLEARSEGIAVHVTGPDVKEPAQVFDRVLIAVGRRPNSTGLGLENTQVETDERGFVKADRRQRTADPHIFAIGDVAGQPLLAHKASREGKVAAEVIAGKAAEFDNLAIPAVVFTDPEVAWCGLTETDARAAGRTVETSRFPWAASGRAATIGRPNGLTKLVFDAATGRLLGMGVVGAGAGELIAEGTLAVEMGAVAQDVADTIHPHPTLSETVMEAAEAFLGSATHLYRPRRAKA
jgi:dihydrolipoamide dehydrogenase